MWEKKAITFQIIDNPLNGSVALIFSLKFSEIKKSYKKL